MIKKSQLREGVNKQMKKCSYCHNLFESIKNNQKFCSKGCEHVYKKSQIAKFQFLQRSEKLNGGGLLSSGLIDVEFVDLGIVYQKQYGFCAFCRQKFESFLNVSVDHITPITKGGSHTYKNIQLVHRECNSSKRDIDPEDLEENIYKRLWKLYINKKNKQAQKDFDLLSEEEKEKKIHEAVENLF